MAAGTPVATPVGPVPIESLRVGDIVWSVDPATSVLYPGRLIAVRALRRPCLELTTQTGRRIVATAEHPFFVPGRDEYRPAGEWLAGAGECVALYARGLAAEPVVGCANLEGERWVYDLTVASPYHNFLADSVLVHNKSPGFGWYPSGPIEDGIEVRNAFTSARAMPGPSPFPGYGFDPLVALSSDAALIGPDILRVAAGVPLDGVVIFATDTVGGAYGGYLVLDLPTPSTTVDLRVVLLGAAQGSVTLQVSGRASGSIGPAQSSPMPVPP